MNSITHDDIIRILKIVAESQVDELHLEIGDLKLIMKKYYQEGSVQELESSPERLTKLTVHEKPSVVAMDENLESEIPLSSESDAQKPKSVLIEEEGFMPIKAPMLGTFYRAPKPEAPPFVKEGQFVKNDDVVCIIEVMKLFNMVRAGVQGRIAKICAENAQLVEYNQVLFLVEKVDAQEKAGEDSFS